MSGYTTKFNIGDFVWILHADFTREKCPSCGRVLTSEAAEKPIRVKVTEINISKGIECYQFYNPVRSCTENNVFATKEEAEKAIIVRT